MATTGRRARLIGTVQQGLGLHLKLAFSGAVTVFICIVLVSVLHVYRQSSVLNAEIRRATVQLEKGMVERGLLLAEGMAASMETAIAGYDFAFITETVRTMQEKNEYLAYSYLTNAAGITIIHTDPRKVGSRAPKQQESGEPRYSRDESGNEVVEITRPLVVGGHEWGWLVLGFDLAPLHVQAAESIERGENVVARSASLTLLAAVFVALLGLAGSVWASRRLLQPVVELTRDAAGIAEGNLDQEIASASSSDEIGVLARQFEAMRRSIKSYVSELVIAKQVAEASMREEKKLRAEIEEHSSMLETKVRERTAELQTINERLTEFDRLKSEFLSNVSHELRSPLASISSAAKIINRYSGGKAENNERFSAVIIEETGRLTRLIDDLLDLSKIEAGKSEWRVETIEKPADLLEHVQIAFRPLYSESGIELTVNVNGELPTIRGDRDRLIQVLTNLCSNARKFTPQGGRVELSARRASYEGRPALRMAVTDNGPGIPPDEREEIFERFHQAQAENKPKGTGLGLSICREVVHYHGGAIWAEGPEEGGTRMVIMLPAAEGDRLAAFASTGTSD